jgi:hypothetical protein
MQRYLRHMKKSLRDVHLPAGALFVFVGAALLWTAITMALDLRQAADLPATVLGKDWIPADRDQNPSTRYRVRVRFVDPGGETNQLDLDVEPEEWEELAAGDTYPVRYVASRRKVIPSGMAEPITAAIVGAVSIVVLLIGRWLFVPAARRLLRDLRLLSGGTPASATVTDVFPTSSSVNRVTLWKLRYRYKDRMGAEHEAESGFLMPDEAHEWQPGSTGAIRYDPRQPSASLWLGSEESAGEASQP